ncbi:MAG: ABC transporter substrate-binding protein [Rubrobacteraceae bacterium]
MTNQGRPLAGGFGRRISRRDFLKVGGAGLAGAALLGVAGCGGDSGSGDSGSGEITFIYGPTGNTDQQTIQTLVDRFNEENGSGITAKFRQAPSDTGAYFDQLRTEFQAQSQDIDVILGDVIWPAQFAANGWIADLSDRFPENEQQNFLGGPIESMSYEGGMYGVPWFTDAGMLYYRTDLLEQSGFSEPPTTWDELKEMAQKVMQDSGTENGFVFQGANYEGGVVDGLEYVWTHGGDVLGDSADQVVIDSPASIAGLATERSMIESGVSPQAVANFKEDESAGAFLQGNSVFLRNWPYVYGLLTDPEQSKINLDQVGVAPLPMGEGGQSFSGLGGWNFYISEFSQKQDAAYEFVQFMTDSEQQKFRALEGGYLPTLQSLYEDQEILDEVPVVRLGGEALQNTRPRPVSPVYSDMSLTMGEQFNASLKGDVTPEEAVKTLQTELQDIVDQAQG